ncbi:MAG: NAD(P)H-dependent oxidoreductase subunit E [Thermoleophilia bacterium]
MLVTQQEQLRADVTALVDRLGPGRSSLVPILQKVKTQYHGIDTDAMQIVADLLDIHPVEVYSVATFYAFLNPTAQGEFVLRLCRTISCELAGKEAIARQLETELGIAFGVTSEDGRFTLEWANCMGMCDQGPALLVNDRVYTRVTPETVREIAAECRAAYSGIASERKEGYLV